jgi:hypothetical protein
MRGSGDPLRRLRRSASPPAAVRELATARPVCLAWENEDALTLEVGNGPDQCFIKWAPAGSPLDLAAEAAPMTVPSPIGFALLTQPTGRVRPAVPGLPGS